MPWAMKSNQKLNSKIYDQIKKSLYNWIIHNPQVVKSPIFNDYIKVNICGVTAGLHPRTSLQPCQ